MVWEIFYKWYHQGDLWDLFSFQRNILWENKYTYMYIHIDKYSFDFDFLQNLFLYILYVCVYNTNVMCMYNIKDIKI